MSRFVIVLVALVLSACWSAPVPVQLETLLPTAADLPPSADVQDLRDQEELVLSIKLDAPSDGLGLPDERTFDPPECKERNDRADAARIGLAEHASGRGVRMDGERTYVVVVSDVAVDAEALGDVCSTYRTEYAEVRTTHFDLPSDMEADYAVAMDEVTDPFDPQRSGDEIQVGYALVNGYTLMVLGFVGAQFRAEFLDIVTRAAASIAANS